VLKNAWKRIPISSAWDRRPRLGKQSKRLQNSAFGKGGKIRDSVTLSLGCAGIIARCAKKILGKGMSARRGLAPRGAKEII